MIVVTGATGHIGSELVRLLSGKNVSARAVTRDLGRSWPVPGVEWVEGDLRNASSLRELFRGTDRLFLLTSNSEDMRVLQENAIEAARAVDIDHIVKLSALGASDHSKSPIGRAHHDVEKALQGSGMAWTILRPHVFMQNLLELAPRIARDGSIRSASGDGKIPFIDTRDIAAVAEVALTGPGHESKKYVLTGPEALSYGDLARFIGEEIGRTIGYVAESLEEARERLVKEGTAPWLIEGYLALAAYQRAGGPTAMVSPTVPEILGRQARTFAQFVRDHAAEFRGQAR
jgi:uncharacterized protein YbjT (DUF2867 family)